MYKTIKVSTEWGIDCKDKIYGHWIDGVMALTHNLVNELDNKNRKEKTD